MNDRLTYLLLDLGSVFFPLVLSFDKKVHFYTRWWRLFPAMLVGATAFLIWDELFTRMHVWSFNPRYITGVYFGHLPLEEWMFFIFIPYACIFIYECLDAYFGKWIHAVPRMFSWTLAAILEVFFIAMALVFHDRVYTLITFAGCAVMLAVFLFIYRVKYFPLFMAMWIVHLIPLFLVNGVLTRLPVVLYNDAENIGLRIGTVPFEDSFYSMLLLLINLTVYHGLQQIAQKKKSTA